MLVKKFNKDVFKFHCEKCNYHGNRKSQYERHLHSKKHLNVNASKIASKKVHYECACGKKYVHDSSYYRHKLKCDFNKKISQIEEQENLSNSNIFELLQKTIIQNNSLKDEMITIKNNYENSIKEQTKVIQDIIPKIGNGNTTNSHNNIINVQMFLNEKCADAMSIQNFAKQLCVTMDDLTKNKMDCLTNVVLKNLRPLSLTERPFHCTNVNTKAWFVKDENQGWEEDNGEKLIKNAEIGIQKKWLNEFESQYPNWMSNETQKDKYVQIAGSASSELPEKIKLKILRELGVEVPLSKEIIIC